MRRTLQMEPHIVVVDARPGDYHAMTCWAGEQRWHVHLLATARAAIKFKTQGHADVWIVNVSLPEMSGFALCEILDIRGDGVPIFIVSDQYEEEHERSACQHGLAYVAKSRERSADCRWHLALLKGGGCEPEGDDRDISIGTSPGCKQAMGP